VGAVSSHDCLLEYLGDRTEAIGQYRLTSACALCGKGGLWSWSVVGGRWSVVGSVGSEPTTLLPTTDTDYRLRVSLRSGLAFFEAGDEIDVAGSSRIVSHTGSRANQGKFSFPRSAAPLEPDERLLESLFERVERCEPVGDVVGRRRPRRSRRCR